MIFGTSYQCIRLKVSSFKKPSEPENPNFTRSTTHFGVDGAGSIQPICSTDPDIRKRSAVHERPLRWFAVLHNLSQLKGRIGQKGTAYAMLKSGYT